MAYDEILAERVRAVFPMTGGVTEKRMFGGWCLLVNGNMCVGVLNDELVVRLGPDGGAAAMERPHTRPMDFTGRPLKGFVYVGPAAIRGDGALRDWVDKAVAFASALPPKAPKLKKAMAKPLPRRKK